MTLNDEQTSEIRRHVDQRVADFEAQQALKISEEVEKREKAREETNLRRVQGWAAIAGVSGFALISGFSIWLTGSVQSTARSTAQDVLSEAELEAELAAGVARLQEEAIERLLNASEAVAEARQVAAQAADQAKRYEQATQQAERQGSDVVARIQKMERDVESFEQFADRLRVARESEAELEAIIREIAADPEIQQRVAAAALPEGAVAVFDRRDGCPVGWSEFKAGEGRFLIGVDGERYRLRYVGGKPIYQLGGTETHALTIEEMPAHTHPTIPGYNNYMLYDNWDNQRDASGHYYAHTRDHSPGRIKLGVDTHFFVQGNTFRDPAIGERGNNRPHNNMPPYIALYFCKKEG